MTWRFTPYVLPLLLACAISSALAAYAYRHRRAAPGAQAFALLMAAVAFWSLGNTFQVAGADLPTKLLWAKIQYLGVVTVPLAWLAFTFSYAGREGWIRHLLIPAAVPSALTLALVFTNERHGLFWRHLELVEGGPFLIMRATPGPWFWAHTSIAYLLLVAGTLVILQRFLTLSDVYRRQAGALLFGLAVPWAVNAAFVFGGRPLQVDPTPFALTVSGVAFAWALFRYRLLQLVPVAREAVIEGMGDGMLVLDNDGRIVELNPAAQRTLGVSASQALGAPAARVLSAWPDLMERSQDASEAQAEIALGEGENRRHYDLRISPLRDRRGRPRGRLVGWHEVTARRRVEAELRAQKQLFENLLAVARVTTERPTLEETLKNTIGVASSLTGAQAASLFLLDEEGRVTRSLLSPEAHTVRVDTELASTVMERGLAGWVARERQAALVREVREDPRWFAVSTPGFEIRSTLCVPIASGASLVGVLTLIHSEPSHFHEAHLQLIQAAADQMALALRNAQIFDARSRMADRQTTLYEVLRAVGEQLDPDAVASAAAIAIAQRTGWPNVVVALPDHEQRHWRFRASAPGAMLLEIMPLGLGIIGRAHATGRTQLVPDVSADPDYVAGLPVIRSELAVPIRKAERPLGVLNLESDHPAAFGLDDVALAESIADALALALDNAGLYGALAAEHERLVELERMRDELTHTLVHDLRSPLTAVSGVLETLSSASLTDNQREMLRLARNSAGRMSNLIDSILDVSRLESGSMPVERATVALSPLVDEALEIHAPLAEEKSLRLECDVPEASPRAWADPELVGRVLQNLIGNAVKFTPAGGGVRVSAALEPSGDGMLRIAVTDTGPGIPADVRGRLFEKFAASGPGHGSGLGLAFCRLAVEAHGGRIWADSVAGAGSTFSFTLPVASGARHT